MSRSGTSGWLLRRRAGRRATSRTGRPDRSDPRPEAALGGRDVRPRRDHRTPRPHHHRRGDTKAFLRLAGDGGPGLRRLEYGGIRQLVIDRWNLSRVKAGLPAWDPNVVYHLRGVPDERIDIDIDTSHVAALVRLAMQEHRTQWERREQPRSLRGPAAQERVAGDRGDRLATLGRAGY